ncbi:MAG TPA: carbohydrate binding domain-containing protein [Myxococcaceae bacterium]|jgi:hypothetical protein
MQVRTALLKPWALSLLALSLGPGCGSSGGPPILGPNLIRNGSFEDGKLETTWWSDAKDTTDSKAFVSPDAADLGRVGLVLHKGTGTGWGSMVGQETEPHQAGETYQIRARLKGAQGGERVTLSFHGQGFEVEAEPRWRTVTRLVYLSEVGGGASTIISVTSEQSTVHVDDVSAAKAEVTQGDADKEEDNLLRNGSFESDLGLWTFYTDSGPEGTAYTTPDAGKSGYAGLVMSKGTEGGIALLKQELRDPLAEGEEYRIEAQVKGTVGGEVVALCMQINHEPWSGDCAYVTATQEWTQASKVLKFGPELRDERMEALITLGNPSTVMVDDVILVRTRRGR